MAAGNAIVLGSEYAPHGGDDAESGEVGAGNQFHRHAFRLLAKGKAGGSGEAAEHIGEDFVVLAEIPEHGMGDGVAAPVAAIVATLHGEQDELLGILDGEEAQQDLVEEGENGGVGADAESQGQDGHGGKAGSAREHAEGVLQVAQDGVEPADDGHAAGGIIAGLGHRKPRVARGKDEESGEKFDEIKNDLAKTGILGLRNRKERRNPFQGNAAARPAGRIYSALVVATL